MNSISDRFLHNIRYSARNIVMMHLLTIEVSMNGGLFMKIERGITLFLNYCRSKQLRPKTIGSYEQARVCLHAGCGEQKGARM